MPQKRTSRSGAMTSGIASKLKVHRQAAHVLLRHAIRLVHIEEERRVLRVRDLEPEQQLEIDREAERLRHPEVHPLAAIRRPGVLRLLQLAIRNREARAA